MGSIASIHDYGIRDVVTRLLFLTLLCALVIPRVAWGAHVSGHDAPIATAVAHVHHGDHSHALDDSQPVDVAHEPTASDDREGLAHNHVPADVLSAMADAGNAGEVAPMPFPDASHLLDRRSDGAPAQAPHSLLRPPRTA